MTDTPRPHLGISPAVEIPPGGPPRILNPSAVGNPNETPVVQLPQWVRLDLNSQPAGPAPNTLVLPALRPDGALLEVHDRTLDELGLSIMGADPTSEHADTSWTLRRHAVERLHAALG